MYRICELIKMEVVNLSDGRRIGYICDVSADLYDGRIESIIVNNAGKLAGRRNCETELIIPFSRIVKIGDDLIIVDVDEKYLR